LFIIIIIIIIIISAALAGPLPPEANVANYLYPGYPPANFYNPLSLRFPLPHQSILISISHVLDDLQVLSTVFFLGNSLSSIRTTWSAHLSLLDFITLPIFGSMYSTSNSRLDLFRHCPPTLIGPYYSAKDFPFEDTQSSFIIFCRSPACCGVCTGELISP